MTSHFYGACNLEDYFWRSLFQQKGKHYTKTYVHLSPSYLCNLDLSRMQERHATLFASLLFCSCRMHFACASTPSLPSGSGICFVRSWSDDINLFHIFCFFHESTLPICVISLNAFSFLLYFHLFSGHRHPLIVTRHYHSGDNVPTSCPTLL